FQMADEIKAQFGEEIGKLQQLEKDHENYVRIRHKLVRELAENKLIKEGMDVHGDDAVVYKQIGRTFIPQDTIETRTNVDTRIEAISDGMKRVDSALEGFGSKQSAQKDKIVALQQKFKKMAS
ncbi:hypothetical protein PFISCL1PPCAC_10058, partial [Pristionchus fissidentatus]